MPKVDSRTRKAEYFIKLERLLKEYRKVFVVSQDNVGSNQMQQIRISLRGKGVVLLGKNTMIRKALRGQMEANPNLEKLLPYIKNNMGFVFTNGDLKEVRDIIVSNKVKAPAKAGGMAPVDVIIPAGNTMMDPSKTSFFQALAIPTKIAKGTIEILTDVHIVVKGERVGASEAALLNMLNISPFSYGLVALQVYDNGSLFSPSILDISDSDLLSSFMEGVANIASVSLKIGFPTEASVPHSIINGFKDILAIAVATDITFKQAEKAKAYLKDPSAFAASAAPAAAAGKPASPSKGGKAAAKAPEPESEEEEDMGMSLFD